MRPDSLTCIAVVGAGPAGCAAALSAAGEGNQVLLFEAGPLDGDKACGDGLVPATLRALETLGIDGPCLRALGAWPYNKLIAADDSRRTREYPMGRECGWVLRRSVLHRELRRRAAERCGLHLQSRVVGLEVRAGRLRLGVVTAARQEQAFDVDAVVLATGSTGHLPRQYGVCGAGVETVAVMQYASHHRLGDAIRFDFHAALKPGYVWWFPAGPAGVNWGACALKQQAAELKPFRERMLRLARHEGYSPPRGGVARVWSACGRQWHHPAGIVSCGDAAGLVNPYNGEGISAALLSGRRAGLAAAAFVAGGGGALPDYSTWVGDFFGRRYGLAGECFGSWVRIANLW